MIMDFTKFHKKADNSDGRTQYEYILEEFLIERGLKAEFDAWLEANYPNDLSKEK